MNIIPRCFFFDDDLDDFFKPVVRKNDVKCDIYEEDGMYHVEMDVPGYDKKDIKLEVKDGYLTVSASKEKEEKENKKNYIRKERTYGSFSRSFALGDVDVDKIDAKFENGILNITVPKEEKAETKKTIEIK